jgi:hypothetical protein
MISVSRDRMARLAALSPALPRSDQHRPKALSLTCSGSCPMCGAVSPADYLASWFDCLTEFAVVTAEWRRLR